MKINFKSETSSAEVAVAVAIFDKNELSEQAKILDETTKGLITHALKHSKFKAKLGETMSIMAPNDLKISRLILLGLGDKKKIDATKIEEAGAALYKTVCCTPDKEVVLHIGSMSFGSLKGGEIAALFASGASLKSYRFDKYLTKEKPEDKPALKTFTVIVDDAKGAQKAYEPLSAIVEGVHLCRELQSEPANVIYPVSYAERIEKELKPLGIKVESLGVKEMQKLGMGALLGVAQGSVNEPRLVVMTYNGGKKDQKPLAFIGKGVTFDTGGISIKPAGGMEEMKFDMSGSAVVVSLLKTLALRKAKANVVGVVGLVENMPSGTAQRPGDIVTSMSGQTIQVENTDAEGRLVLCDAMWYTQERFKPEFMVDLATLTGAIVISLGSVHAGLFSNNDKLAERISKMGDKTGELVWRMPLHERYDEQLKLSFADMNNIGVGREAGSITAAQFLQRFVNDVPWAHLDIAGTAYISRWEHPLAQKGATAMGVRLLNQLVYDHYEG